MRNYDYKSAKSYIESRREEIECAYMGMHEDWFWTAEAVFESGDFKVNLDDPALKLGGISGSNWATPTLEVRFKDGREERLVCGTENVSGGNSQGFRGAWLGCLSGPVQDSRGEAPVESVSGQTP